MTHARPARFVALTLLLACGQAPSATPAVPAVPAPSAPSAPTAPSPAPASPTAPGDDAECCMKVVRATEPDNFYCSPVPASDCRPETWAREKYASTRALTRAEVDEQLALYRSTYAPALDPARSADTPKELYHKAMSWESCLQGCKVLVSEAGEEETMD